MGEEDRGVPVTGSVAEAAYYDYETVEIVVNMNEQLEVLSSAEGLASQGLAVEQVAVVERREGLCPNVETVSEEPAGEQRHPAIYEQDNNETQRDEDTGDNRTPGVLENESPKGRDLLETTLLREEPAAQGSEDGEDTCKTEDESVCLGLRCCCRESLPVRVEGINFELRTGTNNCETELFMEREQLPGDTGLPVDVMNESNDSDDGDDPLKAASPDTPGDTTGTAVEAELLPRNDDLNAVIVTPTSETLCGPGDESIKEDDAGSPPPFARPFCVGELDALERGAPPVLAEQKEEYDKEIEERLSPLDERELEKKVAANAARAKEPTLAELSEVLGLPEETLERNRESSPGVLSSPEYWTDWYRRTLAASEEARRANRDFRETRTVHEGETPVGAVLRTASDDRDVGGGVDVVGDELLAVVSPRVPAVATVTNESVVAMNICVPSAED